MDLSTVSLKDAALDYARRGWRVLPVAENGKVPLLGAWQKEASSDPEMVEYWWKREWPNANIGIACGHGIIVLDVDGMTGEDSLSCLEMENGELPPTLECHTGTGRHLYFACDEPLHNTASTLGEKLDTRGLGGQVVVPPSIHPNGARYTWANDLDPAPLPDWMLTLLKPPEYRSRETSGESFTLAKPTSHIEDTLQWTEIHPYDRNYFERALQDLAHAPEGTRNDRMNRVAVDAGRLVKSRYADQIYVENAVKDAARAAGLKGREIELTWKSGFEKGFFDGTPWEHSESRSAPAALRTNSKPQRREGKLRMTRLAEARVQPIQFLWGYRLQQNNINLISGDGGIGKSTLVMHIIRSVTNIEPQFELPDSCGQRIHGEVLLAAYEDSVARIQQQATVLGVDQRNLIMLEGNVDHDGEVQPFNMNDIPNLVDALEQMPNVRMLVLDPWTEFMVENPNQEDMVRNALKPLYRVAAERQVTVIILSHTNKRSDAGSPTDRIAGNSGLKNRARSVLMVKGTEGGDIGVAHAKSNGAPKCKTILYTWDDEAKWAEGDNPFGWNGLSNLTAEDLFAQRGPTKIEAAESWLRVVLADGECRANEIEALADEEGISAATLRRARERTCETRKDGMGEWHWVLK